MHLFVKEKQQQPFPVREGDNLAKCLGFMCQSRWKVGTTTLHVSSKEIKAMLNFCSLK